MPAKNTVNDPHFDQFLFDLIYSSTRDQRSRFPAEYRWIFESSKKAQKFCVNATMEEKDYVVSLLGVKWFKIYVSDDNTPKDLRDLLNLYKEQGESALAQAGVSKRLYVYSDKKIIGLLSLLSDTADHPSYIHNIDLRKVGYHIKDWQKKLSHPMYTKSTETNAALQIVLRTLTNCMVAYEFSNNLFEMKPDDLKVLVYLSRFRHTHKTHEEISLFFSGSVAKAQITNAIRRLRHSGFIEMNHLVKKKEYTITGIGFEKVNTFVKHVLKSNLFQ